MAKKIVQKNTEAKAKTVKAPAAAVAMSESLAGVLMRPRITEKAALLGESANAYTFDVSPRANKMLVAKAVTALYKVTPVKVRVITVPAKKVFARGRFGVKSGGKKALVYLKKGEKIEFV